MLRLAPISKSPLPPHAFVDQHAGEAEGRVHLEPAKGQFQAAPLDGAVLGLNDKLTPSEERPTHSDRLKGDAHGEFSRARAEIAYGHVSSLDVHVIVLHEPDIARAVGPNVDEIIVEGAEQGPLWQQPAAHAVDEGPAAVVVDDGEGIQTLVGIFLEAVPGVWLGPEKARLRGASGCRLFHLFRKGHRHHRRSVHGNRQSLRLELPPQLVVVALRVRVLAKDPALVFGYGNQHVDRLVGQTHAQILGLVFYRELDAEEFFQLLGRPGRVGVDHRGPLFRRGVLEANLVLGRGVRVEHDRRQVGLVDSVHLAHELLERQAPAGRDALALSDEELAHDSSAVRRVGGLALHGASVLRLPSGNQPLPWIADDGNALRSVRHHSRRVPSIHPDGFPLPDVLTNVLREHVVQVRELFTEGHLVQGPICRRGRTLGASACEHVDIRNECDVDRLLHPVITQAIVNALFRFVLQGEVC
mmetsp:Transcript_96442/g.272714  ORF Transcript_96442/g.272714 Transcript_96442/m.272714 type:complete len:471 (+) Transcript_96442:257-1669(+)